MIEPTKRRFSLLVLTASVLAGLGVFFLLGLIARPAAQATRLAVVEQQVAEAERLARRRPAPKAGQMSACAGRDAAAFERVRQQVLTAGARHNVALSNVFADAEGAEDGAWMTVNLTFVGNGQQDDVVALLDAIADLRPTVFADSVDMTVGHGSVDVSFSGKVVCGA